MSSCLLLGQSSSARGQLTLRKNNSLESDSIQLLATWRIISVRGQPTLRKKSSLEIWLCPATCYQDYRHQPEANTLSEKRTVWKSDCVQLCYQDYHPQLEANSLLEKRTLWKSDSVQLLATSTIIAIRVQLTLRKKQFGNLTVSSYLLLGQSS
jgi:hypothetical protein